MPTLLSGSTLRRGGSGEFIDLKGAQPQLPATETTTTGYTLVTDQLLRTSYKSSLGNLEMRQGEIWSNLPEGIVTLSGTGTGYVYVSKDTASTSTTTGALVVRGGVGIGRDITVNGLTIGQGFEGFNNVVVRGTARPPINEFNEGQHSIAIGYDTLQGLSTAYKNIAIGRFALSSGTDIANSIAIGDSTLKNLGVVHDIQVATVTNVTLYPRKTVSGATNADPVVLTVVGHGVTTGTRILVTDVSGMVDNGLSILNDNLFYVNPTGPDSLELYIDRGLTDTLNGINASLYDDDTTGTVYIPVLVEAVGHGLRSGKKVEIRDITTGTIEVTTQSFYVDVASTNTIALYTNIILTNPVDGTDFTPYISTTGTLHQIYVRDNNIALGTNAGLNLIDGEKNFFVGDSVGKNLSTGSFNFFIGNDIGNNMIEGSSNIAIGGDNLVDGRDNQINIGSVFYYNGDGYLQLNAETGIGFGTTSTSTNSGSLVVFGGVGISDNLYVGSNINVLSTANSTLTSLGAIVVSGGIGVAQDITVGGVARLQGLLDAQGPVDLSPANAVVSIKPTSTGTVQIFPATTGSIDKIVIGFNDPEEGYFTNIYAQSTTDSFNTASGALQVDGGAGIGKNLYVGGDVWISGTLHFDNAIGSINTSVSTATNLEGGDIGSVVYQESPGVTTYLPLGVPGSFLQSDGSAPYWNDTPTFNGFTASQMTLTGNGTVAGILTINTLTITTSAVVDDVLQVNGQIDSTSTSTGSIVTLGGIGVAKSVNVGGTLTVGLPTTATSVPALISNNFQMTSYTSGVITGTSIVNLDQWDSISYRSAKYFIQITDGSSIHVTELLMFHNGSNVYINEYGISTNNGSLGGFDATIAANTVTLRFTPEGATAMIIKIVKTLITV